MKQLVVTGLNHRTAPVALRERLCVASQHLADSLRALRGHSAVHECAILSTCNRVELYTLETDETSTEQPAVAYLCHKFGIQAGDLLPHLYRYTAEKAVEHLFAVASSLDSMVVGEPQILGQVKDAYTAAQRAGVTGPIFHKLFSQALHVGKRVRHETEIGRLAVSVPYAALELVKKIFDDVQGRRIVVIGRGEMSELALRHLEKAGAGSVAVVGRCFGHACQFARRFANAEARPYDHALRFLDDADIVLASTQAPHYLVGKKAVHELMRRRRHRLLLFIDISVPRVVEESVNDIENVYLFNIDHLQDVVDSNYRLRLEEARKARDIIKMEMQEFMQWLEARDVVPTIQAFRRYLEDILSEEMRRTLGNGQLLDPAQRQLVENFGKALINKIGHRPITCLKNQSDPYDAAVVREALRQLFHLKED
ncbi:MAG: glutamyl-tRNA reductase [Candidatus Sumerlaeaceae bacterium]